MYFFRVHVEKTFKQQDQIGKQNLRPCHCHAREETTTSASGETAENKAVSLQGEGKTKQGQSEVRRTEVKKRRLT